MIEYCKTPSGYIGLQVNKQLVAWIYPTITNPVRFRVEAEVSRSDMSNMIDKFETLTGADACMWEIARHEQARARNRAAL